VSRSVRKGLAATRGQEGREEENSSQGEDSEPGVRGDNNVHGTVRAHTTDEPHCQRHGLRPCRTQRIYWSAGTRHEERSDGTQTLERNVR